MANERVDDPITEHNATPEAPLSAQADPQSKKRKNGEDNEVSTINCAPKDVIANSHIGYQEA